MSYDPGTPKGITHIRDRVYAVDSFTGEAASYEVDLDKGTCTCWHYVRTLSGTSGKCKHIQAVERQEPGFPLIQKARMMRDVELEKLLLRYQHQNRTDICDAIRTVQRERRVAAERDTYLKSLFS